MRLETGREPDAQTIAENKSEQLREKLNAYPTLRELLHDNILSPLLEARVYGNEDVDKMWGPRFTFWNVLLHDSDWEFKELLCQLDGLAAKHRPSYGDKKLRAGLSNDPFSFRSELVFYDAFQSHGFSSLVEPSTSTGSDRKADLAVRLHERRVLFEVITPRPSESFLGQGGGFAPMDLDLSKKLVGEMAHHFDLTATPTEPAVIAVDGAYSGLDPVNVESAVDRLNKLTEHDFPSENPDKARLLASKGKLFVSAVLLFRGNSGRCLVVNLTGPSLSAPELQALEKIFGIKE